MKHIKEISCGMLTILFLSIPVWVVSVAWRGPLYALGLLALLLLAVIGLTMLNRLFKGD